MNKILTCLSSPPDREHLVVEFFQNDHQWGELNQETGEMILEIYPQLTGNPWQLNVDELISVLQVAKQQLTGEKNS